MASCYEVNDVGLHVAGYFVAQERLFYKGYFAQMCQFCPRQIGYKGEREDGGIDEHSFEEGTIVFYYDKRVRKINIDVKTAQAFIEAHELIRNVNHEYIFAPERD